MLFSGTRYLSTVPYVDDKGVMLLTLRRPFVFSPVGVRYHRLKAGETVDGLAHRYYKNALLSWAILDANPQYLSEMDMNAGDVVSIPNFEEVVSLYGRNLG